MRTILRSAEEAAWIFSCANYFKGQLNPFQAEKLFVLLSQLHGISVIAFYS